MNRFRFTLASLLKVKEVGERAAEGRLLSARLAVSACQERLADLRRSVAELAQRLDRSQAAGLPLAEWSSTFEQSGRLESAIRVGEGELAKAATALRAAEAAWVSIAREVEVLETLEREQRGRYRAECLGEEQERLNETSLHRWSRTRRDEESG